MKQLLVITRIEASGQNEETEFSTFFNERTSPVKCQTNNIIIKIVDGVTVYDEDNNNIISNIKSHLETNTSELLIIIHSTETDYQALKTGILEGNDIGQHKIAKYSSVDSQYETETKRLITNVVTQPENIEKLWVLFSGNPILEALIHLNKTLTLLPLKGKWSEDAFKNAKQVLESSENIIPVKDKISSIGYKENITDFLKQLEPIETEIINLSTFR